MVWVWLEIVLKDIGMTICKVLWYCSNPVWLIFGMLSIYLFLFIGGRGKGERREGGEKYK